jgi:molecular chaperone DnaK
VTAKDKATNKEQQIRIQASGGLSEADIDKMVKDAELHAAEDKKRRELVDVRNQAEAMIHTAEKSLTEFAGKISESDKSAVEGAVASLKGVVQGEDVEAIKAKTNDLAQASMKLGEAMYKAGGAEPGAGEGQGAAKDDVIDADFKEVGPDEKKSA